MIKTRTIMFVGILMAAVVLLPLAVYAAPPPPPPPLPPEEPASAPKPAPEGGRINLQVQFPEWLPYQWQELWTEVQWLDEDGYWRDVAGWQGTLDSVEDGAGTKTWWVAKNDLGRGPFHWRLYRGQGGRLLATSEQFYLPQRNGETVRVELSPTP